MGLAKWPKYSNHKIQEQRDVPARGPGTDQDGCQKALKPDSIFPGKTSAVPN